MTRRIPGGCTQLCPARRQPTGRSHTGLSWKLAVSVASILCVCECVSEFQDKDLQINVTAVEALLVCDLGAVLIGQFSGQGRADTSVCDYLPAISCVFFLFFCAVRGESLRENNLLFPLLYCFIF